MVKAAQSSLEQAGLEALIYEYRRAGRELEGLAPRTRAPVRGGESAGTGGTSPSPTSGSSGSSGGTSGGKPSAGSAGTGGNPGAGGSVLPPEAPAPEASEAPEAPRAAPVRRTRRPLSPTRPGRAECPRVSAPPAQGEPVFTATLELGETHELGATQYGERILRDVDGATFTGTSIQGTFLGGGLELELELSSGATELEGINVLRTNDNVLIYLRVAASRPRVTRTDESRSISRSRRRAAMPGSTKASTPRRAS